VARSVELLGWTTVVRFLIEAGILSLRHRVQTGSGAYPAFYQLGTGIKRPGREADHSPLSSAR
jgi:hypothetical protein